MTYWEGYDTHFTERYMGNPLENYGGYRSASVLEHCGKMRGHLMIVHGMMDDNVHFEHSVRLCAALEKAGKVSGTDYTLMALPNMRHMRLKDRTLISGRVSSFFEHQLALPVSSSS